MENISGKSRASWMLSCAIMGLVVSSSPCFAQGNRDASQETPRLGTAPPEITMPFNCDSLDPKVCFDIYQRRMGEFGQAMVGAGVRIVALGDSSFLAVGVPQNQTYPAQLEAALKAKGHQVTVTNQGVNGDSATGVLQRLDSAVPLGTDIVVLKIGEHELKFLHASPDVVATSRRTIVKRLRRKGVEVYVFGLNQMNRGILSRGDLLVEGHCSASIACHANVAGLAIIVGRTLPAIEALVKKVEKRRSSA